MTIYYVTTGAWGTGTGAALAASQVDGNFWDLDQRVVALNADLAEGKRIDYVTYTDVSMTFHYTDASTQTIPLPVATLQYVGPWMPSTPYIRGNLFTEGNGFYQVLEDHTSALTFNPNATDGTTENNPLYSLWMPLYSTLDSLNDVDIATGVTTGDVLAWNGATWINQAPASSSLTLDDLTDVVVNTGLDAGEPLVFNGTNWVNTSTIDIPLAGPLAPSAGSLSINRANGEVQRINLNANLTTLTISGWPASGRFARLILEVVSTGSFTLTWPSAIQWAGGIEPVQTNSGRDLYAFVTFDGGTTIYGNTIGQNYS